MNLWENGCSRTTHYSTGWFRHGLQTSFFLMQYGKIQGTLIIAFRFNGISKRVSC